MTLNNTPTGPLVRKRKIGAAYGVILSLAFCIFMLGCDSDLSERQVKLKTESTKPTAVNLVVAQDAEIKRTTRQPATVHAYYRSEIRAKATGFVSDLKVDIGQAVTKGDALAVLEIPEMSKQRDIILARIKRLEAEEKRFESGIKLAEAMVESAKAKSSEAEAEIASVDASLSAAEAEFRRTEDLVSRGSLQARMLDETRKKRDSEKASKEAVSASIKSANAEVTVAEAKLDSAAADLDAAKANTEISRKQLEEIDELIKYATLTAPFDGIVTERNLEPGDLVRQDNGSDDKPLFVVSQVDKVRVRIPVPEADAPLINVGDSVNLSLPSFQSENPMHGKVSRLSGSLDPSTRTMIVECDFPNTNGKLIPGMFGDASIELATHVAKNMLPSRAVRFDESGKAYVYAVSGDNKVTIANIETGLDDGNTIEVVSGIESGQRVIDAHLERFSDGQRIQPL